MPNLRPPVTTVDAARRLPRRASSPRCPPAARFEPLMTLYLTDNTPPAEIARAKAVGLRARGQVLPGRRDDELRLRRHARSSASIPALAAMETHGVVLSLHGEVTDADVDVFDRERVFVERAARRDRARLSRACASCSSTSRRARPRSSSRDAPRRRRRDDHAAAPALFAQRAVRGRPAPAPLLPAGAQARDAPAGAGRGGDVGQSEVLPRHRLARRTRGTRRKHACGCAGCYSAPIALRCTPRRSRMRARSTGSKASRAASAPTSTACRATATRSRSCASRGRCRETYPFGDDTHRAAARRRATLRVERVRLSADRATGAAYNRGPKPARPSLPGAIVGRGKSGLRRAGCRVTPGRNKPPPQRGGEGEEQGHRDESPSVNGRRVKRGNLHPEQHQVGGRRRCSPSPRVGGSSASATVRLEE